MEVLGARVKKVESRLDDASQSSLSGFSPNYDVFETEMETERPKKVKMETEIHETETEKKETETKKTETERKRPKLRKGKGSIHGPRKAVESAILRGQEVNYDQLQKDTGAGRSTVSKVVKELYESGKLVKQGRTYKLKETA